MEKTYYVISHAGIKGMKWGMRRFQNKDGTLTPAGKKRYDDNGGSSFNKLEKAYYQHKDAKRRAAQKPTISAKSTTLAAKEAERYNKDRETMDKYDKYNPKPNKLKSVKNAVDSTTDAVNKLANSERNSRPKPEKVKLDLKKMSDDQMRKEINRALLEKQYNDLFAPQKVNKGRETLGKALETAGTVLTVGATALGIAVTIKEQLRG